MKNVAIVVCLHGDETFGIRLAKKISTNIPFFVGNPLAVKKKVRFIDVDLNRIFPGRRDGKYEERRAFYLLKKLRRFKYVIDVHSSSSDTELFGIITKLNKSKLKLCKKLGLDKIVIMPKKVARNKSLIDHVKCGISLEIGPHEKKENVNEIIKAINKFSNGIINNKIRIFKVFNIIKTTENIEDLNFFIENFKKVKKGTMIAKGKKEYYAKFNFIPIFVGERAYKGILCFAAKKIRII